MIFYFRLVTVDHHHCAIRCDLETGEAGHPIVSVFEAEARQPRQQRPPPEPLTAAAAGREQLLVAQLQQALLRELINYCDSEGAATISSPQKAALPARNDRMGPALIPGTKFRRVRASRSG